MTEIAHIYEPSLDNKMSAMNLFEIESINENTEIL